MLNASETTAIVLILLLALGILTWGYNRSRVYGKLGLLAWLQSVILIAPWLVFFALFAVGIYLNLAGILLLLIISTTAYIYLGKRLRSAGQDTIIRERAAQRIQTEQLEQNSNNSKVTPTVEPKIISDVLPIPEEDLKTIKSIFGIDTFFATETIPYQEGAIFRGNLRGETEESYERLWAKLKEHFGEKYRLFLVEGAESKPVVIILPSTNDPQPTTSTQKYIAIILLAATILTSLEAAGLLLGFDLFSNWGRTLETVPMSLGLWAVLGAHEIGHILLAKRHNIRLSIPFFLPTWQIGSFGAITRFETLVPNRTALFDVAFAGPALGGLASLILLFIGLTLSHPGSLFQIPSQFFQSSILVGTLARVILGDELKKTIVDINPLMIVGWLGLVITALNLLPAGQLDGGRIVQAIYGRKVARRTTIITLVFLGIIAIFNPTNPIPLYWTILVLFLQRELERPSLNELSEPDDTRAAWGLLALFLMLATLIPLSPSLAGQLGIG